MQYKVIIIGAHGLVGDGVLLQCLESTSVSEVLLISRWPKLVKHDKLKELLIPDFLELDNYSGEISGYDACFYCSQTSAAKLDERVYTHLAVDVTLSVASRLLLCNPNIVFSFLSKSNSDTTELGAIMTARIVGKAENALAKLIFRKLYFFRINMVASLAPQKKVGVGNKVVRYAFPLLRFLVPNKINTTKEIGLAMINALISKYPDRIVNVKDIKALSTYHQGMPNIENPLMYLP